MSIFNSVGRLKRVILDLAKGFELDSAKGFELDLASTCVLKRKVLGLASCLLADRFKLVAKGIELGSASIIVLMRFELGSASRDAAERFMDCDSKGLGVSLLNHLQNSESFNHSSYFM